MRAASVLSVAAMALAACSSQPRVPDDPQRAAFNVWIAQLTVECAPLEVGSAIVTKNYVPPNYATDDYTVFMDQTFKLFVRQLSPQAYTQQMDNYSPYPGTRRSTRCIAEKAATTTR
jgi:hypothetical protein